MLGVLTAVDISIPMSYIRNIDVAGKRSRITKGHPCFRRFVGRVYSI